MNIQRQFNSVMQSELSDITNITEYFKGETDAIKGEYKAGGHPDYDRGFGARYELEQILDWRSSQ